MSAKFFSLRSDFFLYKKKLLINIKGTISGNNERVNLKSTVKKKKESIRKETRISVFRVYGSLIQTWFRPKILFR